MLRNWLYGFFATKVRSVAQEKDVFPSTGFWVLGFQDKCAFQLCRSFLKRILSMQKLTLSVKLMLLVIEPHSDSLLELFYSSGCVAQTYFLPAGVCEQNLRLSFRTCEVLVLVRNCLYRSSLKPPLRFHHVAPWISPNNPKLLALTFVQIVFFWWSFSFSSLK